MTKTRLRPRETPRPKTPGDQFTNVVKSSYIRFCTYKPVLILNNDFEYMKTVNTVKHRQDIVTGVSFIYVIL